MEFTHWLIEWWHSNTGSWTRRHLTWLDIRCATQLLFSGSCIVFLSRWQGQRDSMWSHGADGNGLEKRIYRFIFSNCHWFDVFLTLDDIPGPRPIWVVISTPVMFLTKPGTDCMMDKTSPVSLAAPISPDPSATIEIFLACDNGAAISAATCKKYFKIAKILIFLIQKVDHSPNW